MIISRQTGNVAFDNLIINGGLSVNEFLCTAAGDSQRELWMSIDDSKTYRFLPAKVGYQEFIVLLAFHNNLIERLSISISHPGSTWDDETPERIKEDGQQLRTIIKELSGSTNRKQRYNWGKVELWQDFKNAFKYSIIVTYV